MGARSGGSARSLQTSHGVDLASTALVRLNFETRAHHAGADRFWKTLCVPGVTQHDYQERLAAVYGFAAPFEAACAYTPGLRDTLDLRARFRAGLVAQDLLSLGLTPSQVSAVPHCFPLAPFSTTVEALGWMYVVERETLLHDSVRRFLAVELPDARGALSYLSAYRDHAGARWQELGRILDRAAPDDRAREELVIAAHTGFRCLIDWRLQRLEVHDEVGALRVG